MHQTASILCTFGSVFLAGLAFACSSPEGSGTGGSGGNAGADASHGTGDCNFTISAITADQAGPGGVPTVGIVNWSVDQTDLTTASIDFGLPGGPSMTAPADVATGPSFRTLLLGMKGSMTYSYRVKVTGPSGSCTSEAHTITTGAVPDAVPRITRTSGPAADLQARGFIIGSSGLGSSGSNASGLGGAPGLAGAPEFGGAPGDSFMGGVVPGGGGTVYAFIVDADGDPVWWSAAPPSCSRAKMSVDGQYLWMVAVNAQGIASDSGEVARVSMDGLTRNDRIPGLSNCHHDITVLPDGRIACLAWSQPSGSQASDLIESDYQGNVTTIVTLNSNIYAGGSEGPIGGTSYHANSIHYYPADDTYTFGDRNPSAFVKISRTGEPLWQFGGSCTDARAPQCVPGDWQVNHGHDLLDDGTFLIFSNGQSGASAALFFQLSEGATFAATQTGMYSPGAASSVLGDVQRLPNGNTLVAFSTASQVDEIDGEGTLVQSISGPGGYVEWRETLYGPPLRF